MARTFARKLGIFTGMPKMAFQDMAVAYADEVGLSDAQLLAWLNAEHPPDSWAPSVAWLGQIRADLAAGVRGTRRIRRTVRAAAPAPEPVAPVAPAAPEGDGLSAWGRAFLAAR